MGLQSRFISLLLTLSLAPALQAQEYASQNLRSRAYAGVSVRPHQKLRPTQHRSQRVRCYGTRGYRAAQQIWIPGCNEWGSERYWVARSYDRVWIAPVYGWGFDACGVRLRICTQAGYWSQVLRPGYYATRRIQRWVPGHWKLR